MKNSPVARSYWDRIVLILTADRGLVHLASSNVVASATPLSAITSGTTGPRQLSRRRVEYSTTDYILKYVCDVVVNEVHVRYLVS